MRFTQLKLLPSLFSRWEISMPRVGSVNVSDAYKLELPSTSETNSVDLDVIVMLKVVRVVNPKTATMTSTSNGLKAAEINAEAVCCAKDEYFVDVSCAKCPDGSISALNGYACQRV